MDNLYIKLREEEDGKKFPLEKKPEKPKGDDVLSPALKHMLQSDEYDSGQGYMINAICTIYSCPVSKINFYTRFKHVLRANRKQIEEQKFIEKTNQ